jgi:predicted Zn-dependent protease
MRRVALALVCLSFVQNLPARSLNFYSIEHEVALGKQLSAELERQVKLADDPILAEYVNRLAQKIARQSDAMLPVTVRIIESGDLNAFTLPGGHIYLNSAFLRLTESESELAFILAHEIGHVAARHATIEATRSQLLQAGSIPLMVLGGWSGAALRELAPAAGRLGALKGARDFETQADRLGLDFMDRSGYDLSAAIDMFERIEGAERKVPGRVQRLWSDHPITASRIEATQKHLNQIAGHREEYIINTSEYEEMRVRAVALEERRAAQVDQAPHLGTEK